MTNHVPPPVPPYATVVIGGSSRSQIKYHSNLGAAKNAAGSIVAPTSPRFEVSCLLYGFDGEGYTLIWDIPPQTKRADLPWNLDKAKKTR